MCRRVLTSVTVTVYDYNAANETSTTVSLLCLFDWVCAGYVRWCQANCESKTRCKLRFLGACEFEYVCRCCRPTLAGDFASCLYAKVKLYNLNQVQPKDVVDWWVAIAIKWTLYIYKNNYQDYTKFNQ